MVHRGKAPWTRSMLDRASMAPRNLEGALADQDDGVDVIGAGIRRVSRPGCRIYVGSRDIARVRNGLGVAVLSTSRGVLSDDDARSASVGGELLCEVW